MVSSDMGVSIGIGLIVRFPELLIFLDDSYVAARLSAITIERVVFRIRLDDT